MATDINDPARRMLSLDLTDLLMAVNDPAVADGTYATVAVQVLVDLLGSTMVLKSLFDANTVLTATADNTPVATTLGTSTVLGRKATGGPAALAAADLKAILALAGADISDLREVVEDFLGNSTLVAGAGIGISYVDGSNTITISFDGVGFVTYAAGWPGSRPAYDTVVAVSADPTASAPSWLAAGDFYFPTTPRELFNTTSGTTYTFVAGDADNMRKFTSSSAIAATVPPFSSVPWADGTRMNLVQAGTGQVTITPGAGVTIHSEGGALKTAARYGSVSLHYETGDVWYADGRLTT